MEIANEILRQLGGQRFISMTGSKNFGSSEGANYLSMHLWKSKNKAKYLKITLDPSDTYTMHFFSVTKKGQQTKALIEGVYCDQLQSVFTEETGLYTKL